MFHFQINLLCLLFDRTCELRDYYQWVEVEFGYLREGVEDATTESKEEKAKNRILAFEKISEEEIGRRIKEMGSIFRSLQKDQVDPAIVFSMLEWGLPDHINPLRSEEAMSAWKRA